MLVRVLVLIILVVIVVVVVVSNGTTNTRDNKRRMAQWYMQSGPQGSRAWGAEGGAEGGAEAKNNGRVLFFDAAAPPAPQPSAL